MRCYCHYDEVEVILRDGDTLGGAQCRDPRQAGIGTRPRTSKVVPVT